MKQARLLPIKLTLLAFMLLWSHWAVAAVIRVAVDRSPVSLDDTFQITFTAAQSPNGEPDFSPLEQNFSVLNRSDSSRSSWVNGKSSKSIQWTLTVMAKNTGSLVIPPVQFGDDVSAATTVLVTPAAVADNQATKTGAELFLEVDATPPNPYLQSQVVYTLRLYTRIEIARAQLNEPELPDAVVEKLGEDSTYAKEINGVDYSVTERKYAIFPQKSGSMTIKPLVLTAEVISNSQRGFNSFFGSQVSKTKRVESKAITLTVKPTPATFTGTHWLSAEQLVLTQDWSGDNQKMKVGEPLTRTLTLTAKGATVGQLPELMAVASTDERLKIYPDQPILQEQKNPTGLTASRQEKIALMPSKAGSYILPAIEISWFNTQSQTMEVAKIAATTLSVVESTGSQTAAVPPVVAPAIAPPAVINSASQAPPPTPVIWIALAVFFALGWLMTVIFFLRRRAVKKVVVDSNETDDSVKDSIKKLKKACADNNAPAARDALLEWGRHQVLAREGISADSLGAVANFCEARLRDEILCLNQVLYGRETQPWQGKKLFQTFTENKARVGLTTITDKSLMPLHRL